MIDCDIYFVNITLMTEYTFQIKPDYNSQQIKIIQEMILDSHFMEDFLFGRIMQENTHSPEDLVDVDKFLEKHELETA